MWSIRFFVILITSLLAFWLLTCDKSTGPQNQAPSEPVIDGQSGAPLNGATGVSITPELWWKCTDPDGDSLTYDVHFGKSDIPPLVLAGHSGTDYSPETLDRNTKYYWRILARDPSGVATSSDTWSFTTTSECDMSTTIMDFGTICPGQNADESFTITNIGEGTLTGSVSESCDYFTIISGAGSYSLEVGHSHTVTVRYEPTVDGTHTCTIQTGNDCSNVSAIGSGHCEEAEFHFFNIRRSGSSVVASMVSTVTAWDLQQVRLVIYDVDDSKTSTICASGTYSSLQIWQDQIGISENWIYPTYISTGGLPIPDECTNFNMSMRGRLERSPESDEGWFGETDRGWKKRFSISTSCDTAGYFDVDDSYIYSAPTATRFTWLFVEPGSYNDGWIAEMKLKFNGWWVPVSSASRTQEVTVKVIEAKNRPELWPEGWKPTPKKIEEK